MKTALLFPGLGALRVESLLELRETPDFEVRYQNVCEILGSDLETRLREGRDHTSWSLFSALTNVYHLERAREEFDKLECFAGYSIGQWTALYAAGALSFSELLQWVKKRGHCLDRCTSANPGAMLAVIGVDESRLEKACEELRKSGRFAAIANYNAPGQYTVASARVDHDAVLARMLELAPTKVVELELGGAWHCGLMSGAAELFSRELHSLELSPWSKAVVENVEGRPLGSDASDYRVSLSRHLSEPVLWYQSLRWMIESGVERFLEVGCGQTLTRFGFFVDRSVRFESLEL